MAKEITLKSCPGTLLILTFVIVMFLIFFKFCCMYRKYDSLPLYKLSLIVLYQMVTSTKRSESTPVSCIALQFLCGLTKIFDREGMGVFWILTTPYVTIHKAKIIMALINRPSALDKSKGYNTMKCFFGSGLFISKGNSEWRHRRKVLTPAFHSMSLKRYISVFNKQAGTLISKLNRLTSEPWVDISPLLGSCVINAVIEAFMEIELNEENLQVIESYKNAVEQFTDFTAYRVTRPWAQNDLWFLFSSTGRKYRKLLKAAHAVIAKIIQEKISHFKSQWSKTKMEGYCIDENKEQQSFMDILLQHHINEPYFTIKDIQDEVNTFIAAGFDTSSINLRWVVYLVGLHPEIQDNIFSELDSIFGEDKKRMPCYNDLQNMKYLECVIKETLRLYPSVPLIGRTLHEDISVGRCRIPGGTMLLFNIYMLHRDPEQYLEPEIFNPERFLPENSRDRHPLCFLPFSAGVRNCIGQKFAMMQIKVILSHIFRNFRVTSLAHRDKINIAYEVDLKNTVPIHLRLTER